MVLLTANKARAENYRLFSYRQILCGRESIPRYVKDEKIITKAQHGFTKA